MNEPFGRYRTNRIPGPESRRNAASRTLLQPRKVITDPREIAAIVMARM
ncbi:MAG: hypothetical protein M0C28_31955 [Candidatus Moduliflexus flocculans]|nr:hypothetical protein [Candidatus Moduliflexus flocculans]